MTLKDIREQLQKLGTKKRAAVSQRFFKTGPGEYGEGDVFLGVRVPELRKIAKMQQDLMIKRVERLLNSTLHEERLLALLILVLKFKKGNVSERKAIYMLYLNNTRFVNNWDLVDTSAEHIVGAFLLDRSKEPLYGLARSTNLWERRISIMSTFHFIKKGSFSETLRISKMLLTDEEDLIHKAVGWMLREVGKREMLTEEKFLKKHYKKMPRTTLRYAIERFPESKRQGYLKGKL